MGLIQFDQCAHGSGITVSEFLAQCPCHASPQRNRSKRRHQYYVGVRVHIIPCRCAEPSDANCAVKGRMIRMLIVRSAYHIACKIPCDELCRLVYFATGKHPNQILALSSRPTCCLRLCFRAEPALALALGDARSFVIPLSGPVIDARSLCGDIALDRAVTRGQ